MMRRALLLLMLTLSFGSARATDLDFAKGDGGQPGAFLNQAVSARSIGLGQAFTGVANDAAALTSNAAGLAQLKTPDVITLYSSLYEDTAYGTLMYAHPLKTGGAFGVGLMDLRSSGYKKTDINRQRLGTFENAQSALYLGYARPWNVFHLGAAVKVVRQNVDTYSDTGWGVDLSGHWPVSERLSLGGALQNILAPTIQLKSEKETYARSVNVGAQYAITPLWMVSFDLHQTENRSLKPLLGTEYTVANVLTLRTGINEQELNAGIGFNIGQWTIDYAMGLQGAILGNRDLGMSHRFGLRFRFPTSERTQKLVSRGEPTRSDVTMVLSLLQEDVDRCMVSTLTATHVQAMETLVIDTIGKGNTTRPVEILQADGQIKLIKGDYVMALPSLIYAAHVLSADATQQKNLEYVLNQISETEKTSWALRLRTEAKDLFSENRYSEAATKALVSHTLQPNDEADTLHKRARLAMMPALDLRHAQIIDALLKNNAAVALDRATAAFKVDPLNERTRTLLQQAITLVEKEDRTRGKISALTASLVSYREGRTLQESGDWDGARSRWRRALEQYRKNPLAKDALTSANVQSHR